MLIPQDFIRENLIPKIGSDIELSILSKQFRQGNLFGQYVDSRHTGLIYAHRIVAHFIKSMDFVPYFWNEKDGEKKSEDYKVFAFRNEQLAACGNAVLNSTLFYFYYLVYSDAYHCGRELILGFPCQLDTLAQQNSTSLVLLNANLMESLRRNANRRRIQYRTGWVEYDEFYPRLSKPEIDEIDAAIAGSFGLTPEELDFIINYDIKYRMGDELNGEDGEE